MRRIQTTQATGKKWKLLMMLGYLSVVIHLFVMAGLIIHAWINDWAWAMQTVYGQELPAAVMCLGGIVVSYLVVKLAEGLAWWFHG